MHQLNPTSAHSIASDIQQAHSAVDVALIKLTRLATNMLEAGVEAKLPAAQGQKALEAAAEGITTFVVGRNRIVRVHRQMAGIKNESNLKVMDMGCLPGPLTARLAAVG